MGAHAERSLPEGETASTDPPVKHYRLVGLTDWDQLQYSRWRSLRGTLRAAPFWWLKREIVRVWIENRRGGVMTLYGYESGEMRP